MRSRCKDLPEPLTRNAGALVSRLGSWPYLGAKIPVEIQGLYRQHESLELSTGVGRSLKKTTSSFLRGPFR